VILVRFVATLFFLVVVFVLTVIAGTLVAVVGFIPPRGDWALPLAWLWARLVLASALVRLRREGADRIPGERPVVFMANHESWLDLPALGASIPVQVRFVAKRWLFSVPFFGWAISSMGFIPVDRPHRRTATRSFEKAATRIRAGRSLLIHPEGTRTSTDSLLPFQRGGFLIALKSGVPIVPVGIEGARGCLPRHGYLLRPGTITVRFGDPILTAGRGVTARGELMDSVRTAIERLRRDHVAARRIFDRAVA
jgi:1-acyl-sn-glycerol-3-phosphate acyltransferase